MKKYLDDMVKDLTDLIAIKSVKGEPVEGAPYGIETVQALEFMLEMGKKHGMRAVNVDGRAGYLEYGQGDKMIGVLLHLDVVPEQDGWTTDAYTLTERDGVLYGRGVNDDKGPAIAAFYALADLIKNDEIKGYRVRLILGLDEECGSSCMQHYVKTEEIPDIGFVPDADFPVIYAEKGILNVYIKGKGSKDFTLSAGDRPNVVPGKCAVKKGDNKIVYEGKPAHGAAPFDGISAVKIAIDADEALKEHPMLTFFDECLKDKHFGEGLNIQLYDESGKLTVNPGILEIDEEQSTCVLNIRYPVTKKSEDIIKNIQSVVEKYELDISETEDSKPLYMPKDSVLVSTLISVYQEITNDTTSKPLAIGGGTYARTMPNLVAFGMNMPGDPGNAHQADESLKKQRLYEGAAIYRESIKRLGEYLVTEK